MSLLSTSVRGQVRPSSDERKNCSEDSFRAICRSALHLGGGEVAGRLAAVASVVWLGHRYGVEILGVYALAQSLGQYLQPLIDFGLRHVGARLLAVYPEASGQIVKRVQRRRVAMTAAALPLMLAYAARTRLPVDMRVFLCLFAASGALYGFSLDWAAWGREKLRLVGLARAVVPLSILAFIAADAPPGSRVLWRASEGNAVGYLLQLAMFWIWWKKQPLKSNPQPETLMAIARSLAWQRTGIMGLAWLCNLAFNTIDILMLGLMSNPQQVGLYAASYRILNQVLAVSYLLGQVLYPRFARHGVAQRAQMLRARILFPLLTAGCLIAMLISISRRVLITVLFGHAFIAAGPLLLLLAWSIPLDFMTSYLSNAFIAWGLEKKILACTVLAASTNIALNMAFIPRYGASGAAADTLISYTVFLAALSWVATKQGLGSASRQAVALP